MRWWMVLALVGCGDSAPGGDAVPPFALHIELRWSSTNTPDVLGVTVDGASLASGSAYTIDETYDSYVDAVGSFAPRSIVAMTGSGTVSTLMQMYTCSDVPQDQLKSLGRLVGETDFYWIASPDDQLWWDKGECDGVDGKVAAISRARPQSGFTNEVTFHPSPRGSTTSW